MYSGSVILWIVIWHLAALYIDSSLFLPAPLEVFSVLCRDLLPSADFWASLTASLLHIGSGFLLGTVIGIILAVLASTSHLIEAFLWLPIKVMKSVPVASFVILVLLWLEADDLAVFIPAMIVIPTLYINTLTGIRQTNDKLLDMAKLFRVSPYKRLVHIYIPEIAPYVLSACSLAIGMAWKAGVAAEVIGLAKNSIGNELYKTKLYLMTPELFAWTIVIVLLSIICEWLIKLTVKYIDRR